MLKQINIHGDRAVVANTQLAAYLFIYLSFVQPCSVSLQWLPPTRLKDNSPIHHPTSPSPLFLSLSTPPSLKLSLEFWQPCLYVQSSFQALGRNGGRARAATPPSAVNNSKSQQSLLQLLYSCCWHRQYQCMTSGPWQHRLAFEGHLNLVYAVCLFSFCP